MSTAEDESGAGVDEGSAEMAGHLPAPSVHVHVHGSADARDGLQSDEASGAAPCIDGSGQPSVMGADAELCVDVCTLLKLALLPPPAEADAAAVLGGQLEPFLRHWLAASWPHAPLVAELRTQMKSASVAICWLLEKRPTLMADAQATLGSELLLDAVRVVALT